MPRSSPIAAVWFALAALAGGCSAVVDPESLLIRCETRSGEADPCAELGMVCAGGSCQACDPALELCDGRDNDCDGRVDEGHDADGDGFTWCGGGRSELVDCVPDDPRIHPAQGAEGGEESCDGRDDDCDGEVDEDPRCEPTRSCVFGRCPDGLSCDEIENRCVAPRTRGSLCQSDAECGDGFCLSAAAIGLDDVLADSLCATACCSDAHCPEGSVCVQSGNGVRVCLPVEFAGRQNREAGERCQRSSDCASGVCQDDRCVATCSRDADCGDQRCRLNAQTSTLLEGAGAWICGEASGRSEAGALCSSFNPSACASALCEDMRCAAPCGSGADCGTGLACRYVTVRGLLGEGRVTACVEAAGGSQLRTCCTNADCGNATCRALRVDGDWGMYCEEPPE